MYDGVTLPRIIVELALAVNPSNDPNATPYLTLGNPATPLGTGTLGSEEIWTDVTDYVNSISARMGRERELDSTEPGSCVLVFDNSSGDFDPTNATSRFYATTDSNIRPMLAVRVRAVLNATEYQIFRGYATDYSFDFGSDPTATFECHDALFLLAQANIEPPTYTNIIGPRNPDFDNAIDYGTVSGPDSDGWYTCTPGPYGNISHYDCPDLVAGTTYMLAVEIQNADLGDFDMRGFIGDASILTTSLIPTGQSAWFYAVATANGTAQYAEFDGVDQTYKFRNPMVVTAITPGDEVNRMLDAVGLPASLRSVATGDVWMPLQLETVNALSYAQTVALMDNGFLFGGPDGSVVFATAGSIATAPRSVNSQMTFSDALNADTDFTELAVEYSTDSIANNIDVKRVNGWAWQNANDPESINRYGVKALKNSTVSLDALALALDSDALVFAGLIRDRFKDPQLRVTEISVLVNAQPGVVAQVMALQALDRITVQRRYASRDVAVPDFTRELLIQGVTLDIDHETFVAKFNTVPPYN